MSSPSPTPEKSQFFPPYAVRLFLVSIVLILSAALLVDRAVLPWLQNSGKLDSAASAEDDKKLFKFMKERNRADIDCAIWRSEGWPVTPEKGKAKRILVLGDSFVWGDGYSNLNTLWWRQLERELERRGYDNVEVIAAGLCGAGTADHLAWARKLIPEYRPDLVIWGYVTNDGDSPYQLIEQPVRLMTVGSGEKRPLWQTASAVMPNLSFHLFELRRKALTKKLGGVERGYDYDSWELKLVEGAALKRYQIIVGQVSQLEQQTGVPMFAIALPNGNGFDKQRQTNLDGHGDARSQFFEAVTAYYTARYEPVVRVFEKAGVPFINTLDQFVAAVRAERSLAVEDSALCLGINPHNGHPGPFTTHFYARAAADKLESTYAQCLGPRDLRDLEPAAPRFNDWVPPSLKPRLDRTGSIVSVTYPESDNELLVLPVQVPHIRLNLEKPVAASEIKLTGVGLKRARLFVTNEDGQKQFDDGTPRDLGHQWGRSLAFKLPDEPWAQSVSTVWISAQVDGSDRQLQCEIVPSREDTHATLH